MNNFCLSNCISINLNFVLYIFNLSQNYRDNISTSNRFPWLSLNKKALLDEDILNKKAGELWSEILNDNSLYREDINYWINNKFHIEELFKSDAIGISTYEQIKKSYESWFFGTGSKTCDLFSSNLVLDYYNKLVDMAKIKNLMLKDINFYLQVVYDILPEDWSLKNENNIIISPNDELPDINELFNMCCK